MAIALGVVVALAWSGWWHLKDPLIGKWKGSYGIELEFKADGTGEQTVLGPFEWTKKGDGTIDVDYRMDSTSKPWNWEVSVDGDTLAMGTFPVQTYTRVK